MNEWQQVDAILQAQNFWGIIKLQYCYLLRLAGKNVSAMI